MIRLNGKVEYNTTRVVFTEIIRHKEDIDIDVLIGEFDSYHAIDCGEARLADNYGVDHGIVNIVQRVQRRKKETDLQGDTHDVTFYSYIFEKEIDAESYEAEYSFNGKDESRRQLMLNCYGRRIHNMVLLWLELSVPKGKVLDFSAKGYKLTVKIDARWVSLDTYPFMRPTIVEYLRRRMTND